MLCDHHYRALGLVLLTIFVSSGCAAPSGTVCDKSPGDCRGVSRHDSWRLSEQQTAERIAQFKDALVRTRPDVSDITRCRREVSLAVGTRGGNFSYGAVCTVRIGGRPRLAMICNDDMVGHFGYEEVNRLPSLDKVASFTRDNCAGG